MAVVLSKKLNAAGVRYRQRPSGSSGISTHCVALHRRATSPPTSCALWVKIPEDQSVHRLNQRFLDLEKSSGEKHGLLPVPAAILVNKDKQVEFIFYAPNYKIRIDNDVLLAAAKNLAAKQTAAGSE